MSSYIPSTSGCKDKCPLGRFECRKYHCPDHLNPFIDGSLAICPRGASCPYPTCSTTQEAPVQKNNKKKKKKKQGGKKTPSAADPKKKPSTDGLEPITTSMLRWTAFSHLHPEHSEAFLPGDSNVEDDDHCTLIPRHKESQTALEDFLNKCDDDCATLLEVDEQTLDACQNLYPLEKGYFFLLCGADQLYIAREKRPAQVPTKILCQDLSTRVHRDYTFLCSPESLGKLKAQGTGPKKLRKLFAFPPELTPEIQEDGVRVHGFVPPEELRECMGRVEDFMQNL